MRAPASRRMWANLLKAVLVLAMALSAIMLIEAIWDARTESGVRLEAGSAAFAGESLFDRQSLSRFVMEGDESALGADEPPPSFVAECFSPAALGEVHCTEDGSVFCIVSDLEAEELYQGCADALVSHGWLSVESGMPLRGSFVKDSGEYRWAFLDVSLIGGKSSATLVTKGGA